MSTSEYFQTFDPEHPDNREFVHYMQQLAGLDEQQIEPVVASFADFVQKSAEEKSVVVTRLAAILRRPHALTAYLLRALEELLSFFAENMPPDEEPASIAADFRAARIISADDEATIAALLKRIAELATTLYVHIEAASITRGYQPFFDRVQTTVELRGVFPNSQSTEPAAHVGIASVCIDLDTERASLFFQVDRVGLATLIEEFQLALNRLKNMEELAAKLTTTSTSVATERIA